MRQSILKGLDDLHDQFWSVAAYNNKVPEGIFAHPEPRSASHLDVDICLVTHCVFPGGNAATTVTEAQAFAAAGYSVAILNCSIKKSRWKWNWISERYAPVMDKVFPAHRVRKVTCEKLIVRGPRMMMTRNFEQFSKKITAQHAIFVVNNSAWSEDGRVIFSWSDLQQRVQNIPWPSKELCPTGPIIRQEAERDLASSDIAPRLSPRDWPPVIDPSEFDYNPRATLDSPIVIGRHARDHPAKWLEDRSELLAAYPDDDADIRVSILGGADTVEQMPGGVPTSWEVLPFGLDSVRTYLGKLDVFVNFPSPQRHEAFGRTIVEAILSGLPVILPRRFEATFGDLAIYCSPDQVRALIDRIAADDAGRLAYIDACRDLATELFCAPSLVPRLEDHSPSGRPTLLGAAAEWRQSVQPSS